ncbi:MAG: RecX family transcriptional regulator [Bacteroidales bacterium]|nr:RecX family transcriptional regulator [Bacteroidales bacterium]MDE7072186.1 RecX family transcriptional regulator [Bacteroidales bacterium]
MIYTKMTRYCAYQERSKAEVRQKLRLLGADSGTAETVMHRLEEEGYIDEARFAGAYVRGKFRINGWGRLKIKNGLRAKGVDEKLIAEALREELNEDLYLERLREILSAKGMQTALWRGFEPELVRAEVKNENPDRS